MYQLNAVAQYLNIYFLNKIIKTKIINHNNHVMNRVDTYLNILKCLSNYLT